MLCLARGRLSGPYIWKFTGLDAMRFKEFVAPGTSDEEVDRWIRENAMQKGRTGLRTGSDTAKAAYPSFR
jgi:hypothetical protein